MGIGEACRKEEEIISHNCQTFFVADQDTQIYRKLP